MTSTSIKNNKYDFAFTLLFYAFLICIGFILGDVVGEKDGTLRVYVEACLDRCINQGKFNLDQVKSQSQVINVNGKNVCMCGTESLGPIELK